MSVVALALVLALAVSAWLARVARADGDPASDVLATQTLFLPQDAGLSAAQQAQLERLLQETARANFPLRVAVIASASDLGSVTELWRQPATYARFLGEELSLTYRGTLLVIMPNGFGVFDRGLAVAVARAALRSIPPAAAVPALGSTAVEAVRRLAAAAGHPVALPAATARASRRPSDRVAWLAFLAGAALIAAAWTASLRARPLGQGRGLSPS